MALRLKDKKAIVSKIAGIAASSSSAVIAEYRGLTVEQMNKLRLQAREIGIYVCVVRNTLAKKAIENTSFDCLQDNLAGPLVWIFSQHELGGLARLVQDFAKEHSKLAVNAIAFEGKVFTPDALEKLANLPTRNEAIATFMAVAKAPITKFVRTMAEPYAQIVRLLSALREKKQG